MSRPSSLGIGITAAVVATAAVSVAVGTVSYRAVRAGDRLARTLPLVQASSDMMGTFTAVDSALARLGDVRVSDPAERGKLIQGAREALGRLDQDSERLEDLEGGEEHAALWAELKPLRDAWRTDAVKLLDLQARKDAAGTDPTAQLLVDAECMQLFVKLTDEYRAAQRTLARLVGADSAAGVSWGGKAAGTVTWAAWVTGLGFLGGIVGLALMSLFVQRFVRRSAASLAAESEALRAAVMAGDLDRRASAEVVSEEFHQVIAGMNRTLEAVVAPLRVAGRQMDQIARGDIPAPIDEDWHGEFGRLRDSMNQCSAAVSALLRDVRGLTASAVGGRLQERADAARHQGDFGKVVREVNATLDAVLAPVGEATRVLGRMAARDITERVTARYEGDHAVLVNAVNGTASALASALDQVTDAVRQVSSASDEIAGAAQAVARGTTTQAADVERINGQLEGIAAETRSAAAAAGKADERARQAQAVASKGSAAMEGLNQAMGRIRASAEGTSQIIRDINEIAFQTNLLALNAAVEAARAGEAGRGFAVVAEEVRSLALRSKEASQKTEALIRESVQEAVSGGEVAREVGAMLGEIATHVNDVTGVIGSIATSAREQTASIGGVKSAVAEVDKVMQSTAASAEQSASAAEELSAQAEDLGAMVSTFRLGEGQDQVAARAAVQPARPRAGAMPQA